MLTDSKNRDVLDYINKFADARNLKIEEVCELKITQLICNEYEKKGERLNVSTSKECYGC